MLDLPEHLSIPVDRNGDGPSTPEDTVGHVCWCNKPDTCPYGDTWWKP